MKRAGRRTPYTDTGIRRVPCVCCGAPAVHQWQACADAQIHRPICSLCDVGLNFLALAATKDPRIGAKIRAYCRALDVDYNEAMLRGRGMADRAIELSRALP